MGFFALAWVSKLVAMKQKVKAEDRKDMQSLPVPANRVQVSHAPMGKEQKAEARKLVGPESGKGKD
jgi:hypothetical protein